MKIILKSDVKNVGKVGQIVNVSNGFARNFLFPRKLALLATEKRVKEFDHLKRMADAKVKKAKSERKNLLSKLEGKTLTFKMNASETDKLFGSITPLDISRELDKQGFNIDKKDIQMEDHIKILGQHKAKVVLGEDLESEITILVERQ